MRRPSDLALSLAVFALFVAGFLATYAALGGT